MKVLTIAIPTYNRVFTLKQALKYVLQQYSEKTPLYNFFEKRITHRIL